MHACDRIEQLEFAARPPLDVTVQAMTSEARHFSAANRLKESK